MSEKPDRARQDLVPAVALGFPSLPLVPPALAGADLGALACLAALAVVLDAFLARRLSRRPAGRRAFGVPLAGPTALGSLAGREALARMLRARSGREGQGA